MSTKHTLDFNPFSGPELESVYPLTDAQKEIWISSKINSFASLGYNESLTIHFKGNLKTDLLIFSIKELVNRHESLRATISQNGSTMQILRQQDTITPIQNAPPFNSIDWQNILLNEVKTEFDLTNGPLFRSTLYCHAPEEYSLFISAHHIICDGWSLDVLLYDLASIYSAKDSHTASHLNTPRPFCDYIAFQKQPDLIAMAVQYWKTLLSDEIPYLDLPIDYSRPPVRTYNAGRVNLLLDEQLQLKIKQLITISQSSFFAIFLTAWATQIYRHTNQTKLVIGVPIAGQPDAGMGELVGHCVSLIPVLLHMDGNRSFIEQVKITRTAILDAYEHRHVSFGSLLQKIKIPRDPSRIPLISICFTNTQKYAREKIVFPGCEVDYSLNPRAGETFELHLNAIESSKGIELLCHYNTNLFKQETIQQRLAGLEVLLHNATLSPNCLLDDLSILSPQESSLLSKWNSTETNYPKDITLIDLLNDQLKKSPDEIAISFESTKMTFKELHDCADTLAEKLILRGIKPDTAVGILSERSLEMVIGILAVIKAGGAYVPIEPTLPAQRIKFMLNDIGNPITLIQERLKSLLPDEAASICLDSYVSGTVQKRPIISKHTPIINPDTLAYIIFTSGSTGTPKGVGNTHQGICNRLLWMRDLMKTSAHDRILQKTPFGFDVSVWEFFLPLITGAQLIVAKPGGHQDPMYLISVINSKNISCIHFVPSMLQAFLGNFQASTCRTLHHVICSGEALSASLRDKFFEIFRDNTNLFNLYGPTEAAVDVTIWECSREDHRPIVPIGRPVANTAIYILNKKMHPNPIGVAGELYIGGVQVAQGYINRAELNKERFIPDPFISNPTNKQRTLFRTGDLARWLPDGTIDFLGRNDFQVKIRGMRIELGEIEQALKNNAAIKEAVVIVIGDSSNDKKIIAYVVSDADSTSDFKSELLKLLPEYMVPWKIIRIDSFPVTSNGKLDRKALPIPAVSSDSHENISFSVPANDWENIVATIWKETLNISECNTDDNFFDLGGHSLLLAEVQNRLNKIVKHELTMIELFQHTTIKSLAQHISGSTDTNDAVSRAKERAQLQRQLYKK
jgi:amino acid adenylation domain-containing protein